MGTKNPNIGQFADLLLRVNNDLAVSDSLIQALDTLINITSSVIGTERGTVFIHDNETQEIYSFVAQGNLKREIRFMQKCKHIECSPRSIDDIYALYLFV